jgi:hypothetical protein
MVVLDATTSQHEEALPVSTSSRTIDRVCVTFDVAAHRKSRYSLTEIRAVS